MYHTNHPKQLKKYLEEFGTDDTIAFFKGLGLLVKQKNGGLYPVSEQASSVLDALRFRLDRDTAIRVRTGCRVESVCRDEKQNRILLECGGESLAFDRVIFACGGMAAPRTGSDGSGYRLAKMLGHGIVTVVPALVQLRCREDWFGSIAGVRAEAEITLGETESDLTAGSAGISPEDGEPGHLPVEDGAESARGNKDAGAISERGELQLTDYGISGIPVFQLSGRANYMLQGRVSPHAPHSDLPSVQAGRGRMAARKSVNKPAKEVALNIDFLPDYPKEGFAERMIRERMTPASCGTVEEYFTGVLNKKLMGLFVRMAGLRAAEPAGLAPQEKIRKVYELCRKLQVHVTGSNSFDQAQVCAGGVPLDELTERLESKKVPGVFFAGELLDVDGRCGGYNLHWAWCSGCLSGMYAAQG